MVVFSTTDAQSLLRRIKEQIDNGSIKTWSYDSDGDFTHTPTQWASKAWMRPATTTTGLQFRFLAPATGASRELFAVYQGRIQEMMMSHFYNSYSGSTASPRPAGNDSAIAA